MSIITIARKAAKNFLAMSSSQALGRLLNFLAILYLARVLGAENFGKISFALAILVFATAFADQGLSTLGVREVARHFEKTRKYVNNIVTFRMSLALVVLLIMMAWTSSIDKTVDVKHLIIAYSLYLIPSALSLEWFFRGIEKMGYNSIAIVLHRLSYLVLVYLFVRSFSDFQVVPYLWLMAGFVETGFMGFFYVRRFGWVKPEFNILFWKKLAYQAVPMGLSLAMLEIYYYLDTVMLGFMKSEQVVGWYSAAYRLVFLVMTVGALFGSVVYPAVSRCYPSSLETLKRIFSHSAKAVVFVGMPVGVGVTILAKPIMDLVYGPQYGNGVVALQILVWSGVLACIRTLFAFFLLGCDRQKQYMYSMFFGAITAVVLNYLLIPYYSLVGAAIATLVAEVVLLTSVYFLSLKVIDIKIGSYVAKLVATSCVMGLAVYFMQWNVLAKLIGGATIYFLASFAVKTLTAKDLVFIKDIVWTRRTA